MKTESTPTRAAVAQPRLVRLWTCDACGKEAEWGDGWATWGSIFSGECGHYVVTCSEACRESIPDPDARFRQKYGRSPSSKFYCYPY